MAKWLSGVSTGEPAQKKNCPFHWKQDLCFYISRLGSHASNSIHSFERKNQCLINHSSNRGGQDDC